MSDRISIRPAGISDLDFIVTAIIEAEKSGTEVLTYTTLYGLDEEQTKSLIKEMLEEEIEGQEICLSHYWLALNGEDRMGALCAWVEGQHGDSSQMKAALLGHCLPEESLRIATRYSNMLQDLRIPRQQGVLQVECVYTAPAHRRKGVISALIGHLSKRYKGEVAQAQLMVMAGNKAALKAYENIGFRLSLARSTEHTDAEKILPSTQKCSMILDL